MLGEHILIISARAIAINYIFASECCINAMKKQQRKNKEAWEASSDGGVTVGWVIYYSYIIIWRINRL